jgi:ferritin-like metal-binding protein YciE
MEWSRQGDQDDQKIIAVIPTRNLRSVGTDIPQLRSPPYSIPTGGSAMVKEPKKLDELFHDTLKDIYFAEKKIVTALPKMVQAAQNDDLRAAFEKHLQETEGQIERLERVFEIIEEKPQGKTCKAILGILGEGQEIIKEYKASPALDAGMLAAAQAVEHYEISRYGTLRTWAQELGLNEAVKLLEQTLAEEEKTDEALSELAEVCVNQEAQAKAA